MLYTRNVYKIEQYFLDNPDVFSDYEKEFILWYTKNLEKDIDIPYFVLELYDELGILSDDMNVYQAFFDLLKNTHSINNKNIIEVGGGIIPTLGKRIEKELNTGRLTIYDPRLSRGLFSNKSFVLKREEFHIDTPKDDTNIIIGLKPCEVLEEVLNWAIKNRVDFMIGMCDGGYHGEPYDYFDSSEEWIEAIKYIAYRGVEDNNMGRLHVKKLDINHYNYPVIYNKR